MSEEPPAKRVRKGTKSCQECRYRKTRCIWPTDDAQICQSCSTKNRTCRLQVEVIPASDTPKLSSRARISALENQVAKLWQAISGGSGHSETVQHGLTASNVNENRLSSGQYERPSSPDTSRPPSPPHPPGHLLHLFDNDLLDSNGFEAVTPSGSLTRTTISKDAVLLIRMLPSREDMKIISTNASSWLAWYKIFFSLTLAMGTGDAMLAEYDRIKLVETNPVVIATLLLSITITVQQAPEGRAMNMLGSIPDAPSFIRDVSALVEKSVIVNDDLIASMEGIRCGLLFIRLQLGRARVRKTWLTLRRVIAVAQLIGLPKAAKNGHADAQPTPVQDHAEWTSSRLDTHTEQAEKAEIWESVCTIDRIASMMWSLPTATANFPLPMRPIVDVHGELVLQSFIHRLANIASLVFEIDDLHTSDKSAIEVSSMVMATDQQMQDLAQAAPKSWWEINRSEMSPAALFQYWHTYITIRTHLRLALSYDRDQRYFYNFMSCLNACQELARRYVSMSPLLPKGFFARAIIDLQAFSAIIFLVLATNESRTALASMAARQVMDLHQVRATIDEALRTMEQASKRVGSESARHGVETIKGLRSLLAQPNSAESHNVSLLLPLIGRIHVSRKSNSGVQGQQQIPSLMGRIQGPSRNQTDGYNTDTPGSSYLNPGIGDSMSYSMEVPDDYLFFTDKSFGTDQWLTWTN